ncbi:ComF family protein [filamentous cyanobacterium LEGE 11480]|uniref:ComF family protein n=1 Tax=Romeriopsis navalis LEGE 11480 TaxID=2777977 RepID=A0A928Z5F1_9CYAN|nr:ComF family protein [Romeriopsis navalis]MBE9031205.1 ComF family protein [Romeriopsis navalis LEGE 11480]
MMNFTTARRHLQSLWLLRPPCLLCERPIASGRANVLCTRCDGQLQQCQQTCPIEHATNRLIWGRYDQALRRLLHQLKYHNQPQIAKLLGPRLAQAWQQQQLPNLAVVPIPLHPDKQHHRGYNQAELIARSFCQFTGMRCYPQMIQRHKFTQPQHGLSRHARQRNLESAFTARNQPAIKQEILLVDDIYTTGSTIAAATACLSAKGHTVWGSLIVAQ